MIILGSLFIIMRTRSRKKVKNSGFLVGLAAGMMVLLGIFRTNIPKNKHEISQTDRSKKDKKKSKQNLNVF